MTWAQWSYAWLVSPMWKPPAGSSGVCGTTLMMPVMVPRRSMRSRPAGMQWISCVPTSRLTGPSFCSPRRRARSSVMPTPRWEPDGRGKLSRLYIDAGRQGRGIGSALLGDVERRLGGHCRSLWLEVDVLGEDAIAFYRRKGYVETGRTRSCGDSSTDIPALIMERAL